MTATAFVCRWCGADVWWGLPQPEDPCYECHRPIARTWAMDDGGRAEAGFVVSHHDAGDCVCRAVAIAFDRPYREVYEQLASARQAAGGPRSARGSMPRKVFHPWLLAQGWEWTPTMSIGSGCTVHLRADELPAGRLIVRLSKHVCAVIDGVIHDTHDPSREGTRCVYGYYQPPGG